jgi:DNA-binding response OmpR family regulator
MGLKPARWGNDMPGGSDRVRGARILVIDDDPSCSEVIAAILRDAGHEVHALCDPRKAVGVAEQLSPEVIVLDEIMPFVDGISLCVDLRARMTAAILMVSAKAEPHDRTLGLRVGADDYLAKPFDANELEARVTALLRRYQRTDRKDLRRFGSLELDRRGVRASFAGALLDLTATEFRLLDLLSAAPRRVFTRDELLRDVWGGRVIAPTRAVDVHMGRLRRKLERAGVRELRVQARRGFGYCAEPMVAPLEDRVRTLTTPASLVPSAA